MKKAYSPPQIDIARMQAAQMLCLSTYGTVSTSAQRAKQHRSYDDEEDEDDDDTDWLW